jgi:hypothetical protein
LELFNLNLLPLNSLFQPRRLLTNKRISHHRNCTTAILASQVEVMKAERFRALPAGGGDLSHGLTPAPVTSSSIAANTSPSLQRGIGGTILRNSIGGPIIRGSILMRAIFGGCILRVVDSSFRNMLNSNRGRGTQVGVLQVFVPVIWNYQLQ